jgi:hypothetical protein
MTVEQADAARRLAEARIRRKVAENLMLDWSRDFLLAHGPRVSAAKDSRDEHA